jgi:hypothetical protein
VDDDAVQTVWLEHDQVFRLAMVINESIRESELALLAHIQGQDPSKGGKKIGKAKGKKQKMS